MTARHTNHPKPRSSEGADTLDAEVRRITVESGGRRRHARLVVPRELPQQAPLFLFFHGSLQNSTVLRRFTGGRFDQLAVDHGAVLAYPDGVGRHFNDSRRVLPEETRRLDVDDVGFTRDLIAQVSSDCGREFAPVVGLGFSNGGQMVMRVLRDAPGILDVAVVFAATWPTPGDELAPASPAPRWQPTPMLFVHGTADPLAPYSGGLVGLDPKRSRGIGRPAPETAELFARKNGLSGPPVLDEPGPGVERAVWADETAPVELWTLLDAGHVIPGGPDQNSRFLGPDCDAVDAGAITGGFLDRLRLK